MKNKLLGYSGLRVSESMKNPIHQKAAQEVFLPLSEKILFYDFTSE